MKLVFLGDSLTWGHYGGNYVAEVAALLPEHSIMNAGEGGNTVVNLLRRLDTALAQEPDGLFVMVGGNDTISYSQPATRPYYAQVQKIPAGMITPEQFAQTYRDLLTQLQLAHIQTWVGLENTDYSPQLAAAFAQFNGLAADAARSFNIPVLDFNHHFPASALQHRPPLSLDSINLIGRRINAGWADYDAERARGGYTYTFDGLHWMPDTARQAAKFIVEFLRLK